MKSMKFSPIDNLRRIPNVKDVEIKDYTIHDVVEESIRGFFFKACKIL